jgi:hypothetical protein
MSVLALVIRGNRALARPEDSDGGPVPSTDEIREFLTVIDSFEHNGVSVISSSTGEAPDGWRWLPIAALQAEAGDTADSLGEAVLCGGV